MMENAYRQANRSMTEMQRKKRPRYTLDPSILQRVDNVFSEKFVPRLGLLDSEAAAYNQLVEAAGMNPHTLA